MHLSPTEQILAGFKAANRDLFEKDDMKLALHLATVLSILAMGTAVVAGTPWVLLKIVIGVMNAFCWFSLINVTIHHHHTHHNGAASPVMKKVLDFLYLIAMPNAPKRRTRYIHAHMNHHFRPFHETDVDHHYGAERFLRMIKNPFSAFLYILELTFVGGHVPGWEDDHYMNTVPLKQWNRLDYAKLKQLEIGQARKIAAMQWGVFLLMIAPAFILPRLGVERGMGIASALSAIAWGWAFPMLLVKNWAHFLGQFQHYDEAFLQPEASPWKRAKTFRCPSFMNYLAGGEISGHFLHHLFPELPYYNVESARKRFFQDPFLVTQFVSC